MLRHGWPILKDQNPQLTKQHIQPNAIDITLDELYEFEHNSTFILSQEKVEQHTLTRPVDLTLSGFWNLEYGKAYPFKSNVIINVPDQMAGWKITRSSLNRNGIFIQSGLYDQGFQGTIAGTMYCFNPSGASIEKGSRIAQFIFADAEGLYKYDGQYQNQGIKA